MGSLGQTPTASCAGLLVGSVGKPGIQRMPGPPPDRGVLGEFRRFHHADADWIQIDEGQARARCLPWPWHDALCSR